MPSLAVSQTPTLSDHDELDARLARLRRINEELDAALDAVDRHRKELARINREVAELAESIGKRQKS
jgi:hypothetical protein